MGKLIIMNLLTRLRSLFSAPCGYYLPPPNQVPPPPPPVPPVPREPSCFIRGVAKSLREDPAKAWVTSTEWYWESWDEVIKHRELGVVVRMRWRWAQVLSTECNASLRGCTWLKQVSTTGANTLAENELIAQALEARPRHEFAKHIAIVQADEALKRRAQDHFTNLGCPPKT